MTPDAVTPTDAPLLAALHAASFGPEDAWGPGAIATMLELPGGFGLWWPGNGFVLAHVAADEAEIMTLCVVSAARRRGLGSGLLVAAMARAAVAGAAAMLLEVAESNEGARRLYAAAEFRQVGRRPRYYRDGGDALLLRRSLRPPAEPDTVPCSPQ